MRESAAALLVSSAVLASLTVACNSLNFPNGFLASQSQPLPEIAATPALPSVGFSSLESSTPVRIGTSQSIGGVTLVVRKVIRPAGSLASGAGFYTAPDQDEEYLAVDVRVTCTSPDGHTCNLSTFDFGAKGNLGVTYVAELTRSRSSQYFDTADLLAGKSRTGYLLFLIKRDDIGLVMTYPRGLGFPVPSVAFSLSN
jgi:Domain of unknown function (DUF4352)